MRARRPESDGLFLRLLDGRDLVLILARHVATVTREDVLRQWALPALVERGGVFHLADSAAAAAIAAAGLTGRSPSVTRARAAGLVVAGPAPVGELAVALHVDARTIRRLASSRADARLVRAIRLQLGLRPRLGTQNTAFVAE
ncbi:MAG: hypothetical protein EXR71_12790 [Myxococcales bacterium]|nr:hypothetical protein [Myxococcales bacterium]